MSTTIMLFTCDNALLNEINNYMQNTHLTSQRQVTLLESCLWYTWDKILLFIELKCFYNDNMFKDNARIYMKIFHKRDRTHVELIMFCVLIVTW